MLATSTFVPIDGHLIHSLTSLSRDRQATAYIAFAAGAVALTDGLVSLRLGKGVMNHWSFVPVLAAFGALLLGYMD